MNRRLVGAMAAAAIAFAIPALAQEKKMEMPKPGPEAKKLGYFVGSWTSEADIKQNPMMPAGKMTESAKCEWFQGGFTVVCHSNGSGPMGKMNALGILGYDTENKKYTYYGVGSDGHAEMATGSVDGNTWTYTSDEKMGGKVVHGRYTMMTGSPTEYTFKWEMSDDGQKWTEVMSGKSTKAAKAAAMEKKEEKK